MFKKFIASVAIVSVPAWAVQPPFTGADYSGRYQCTGMDSHIGPFEGVVEMKLNAGQSTGEHGAYSLTLTLPDNSRYNGFAAANLSSLAIYFAHTDPSLKDYGVGLGKIAKTPEGKTSFTKYYYGPEYEGGGHGFETCIKS
ncbi:hypothetical protein [Pseudomonas sp. P8_241]|uniref:hypothetical protein n=1 Tax=Pseudomonas sp. P8_241 TaxID=3043445 RepID=UPI002A36BE58|nr:hypothetical protein [Pseudomonas sp. P8_241]WPN47762.1 hypothetical protein QMK58_03500 [Pseudomonas sp. P8_241]